jgi:hypothetical protein
MRIIYDKLTKAIVVVITDNDSSITAFPSDTHCALQSDANTLLQMALAIGLNMPELIQAFQTNNIPFAMTPQLEQILKERAFGIDFCTQVIDRIRNMDALNNTQRLTLLNTIKDGMNTLQWGDIQVARAAFNAIAITALFTQVRKDWILAQLDAYINS